MWKRKERKYGTNKGKICKADGCNHIAKVKGYCNYCYPKYYRNKMTYKKAGVDIEKEIQEQIDWWSTCYGDESKIIDGKDYIPSNIKNDLWRDILTSVFYVHNKLIISKLEE